MLCLNVPASSGRRMTDTVFMIQLYGRQSRTGTGKNGGGQNLTATATYVAF